MKPLEAIYDESLRRGYYGHMPDTLYSHYVMQRHWEKARKLNKRFPREPRKLPAIVEPADAPSDVPAVYTVSKDGRTLTYKQVDLTGPIIISAASPGCHFSLDAVKLIQADQKLAATFKEHAINVYSAAYGIDAEEIAQINREGGFRYDVLYRGSGWKGFDFSLTPQFYFVKNGKIVSTVGSGPKSDLIRDLAEGIAKIGLK